MTNFEALTEMVKIDKFLYKTICDVVGDDVPTLKVYEIFEILHKQETWNIKQIEVLANE